MSTFIFVCLFVFVNDSLCQLVCSEKDDEDAVSLRFSERKYGDWLVMLKFAIGRCVFWTPISWH